MQSTQRIIDNIRNVANQMDAIMRRDLLDAASRLQEQSDLIERMQSELAQAISERTPHDYGLLAGQRDDYRERLGVAAKEVFELEAKVKLLTTERDGYFSEMERMQRGWNGANQEVLRLEDHLEDLKRAAITNLTAAVALVRPEPSRLEIAAIILTGSYGNSGAYKDLAIIGLKQADALIAASKEGQ